MENMNNYFPIFYLGQIGYIKEEEITEKAFTIYFEGRNSIYVNREEVLVSVDLEKVK